ncbi:MAG: hypothetical protein O3A00_01600 [Planctomycetota bacterium]|nr:hypothetical protein [Planctomycetota bacterium]
MAPVDLQERAGETGPDANQQGARCSNKGFLPMSTVDYLSLLDWTARRQRIVGGFQDGIVRQVQRYFQSAVDR